MAIEIRVPSFGESITESTVAQWHKPDGAMVQKGDLLVTLDTEKSSADLEAEVSGRLKILVPEGTDVKVGAVIGILEESVAEAEGPAVAPKLEPSQVASPEAAAGKLVSGEVRVDASTPAAKAGDEQQKAPSAAPPPPSLTMSSQAPVTPGSAPSTGGTTCMDASARAPEKEFAVRPTAPAPQGGGERTVTRKPMSRLRKTIARRLLQARQETAMLTTFAEVDMSAVQALRQRYQESFLKRYGVKLGLMSFFVKAVIEGLRLFPELNASIEGDDIVYHNYYDIGVAVSTERGLVVPVVRDADRKSFADIEREIADLAQRARENRLALAELEGGTFTITNGGVFGSLLSTPLLNPPQVGILGMHAIVDRPVAIEGRVEIRPMMYLALSYDHRLIDGREAVQFLVRVKECIANPERIVLGI
ncbi:MAG: 2-oxoglutarate dehydrogenase complex dihydrolipoyllysine-residue succinyltransferase [Candidatus Hydrogenedentota bacterium]|nr:MAG: 2-oxoglutarate dehydrogenase complex dihydrolipoyllysine-residue succinyltransferase [Candidatus Hydrogenedentota bacterium]